MALTATVYCASSRKVDQKYFDATIQLADTLLERNVRVIYGGGAVGLMGTLADRYLEKQGMITGVIPEFMVKVEWAHPKVQDMHIVHDMHERKKKLIEGTDAVIALPGGTGTLEELAEVITLKRLGKFTKPIFLMNTDGFYDPLNAFLLKMADENFLSHEHLSMWRLFNHPADFWSSYESFPPWHEDKINLAQV
ncbi:MAG: TIGR00730 family Rossman fold protein [Bacteroidales bacterium]|nr:TIGR00730 family Rossman fold protein [Bacteroidales bacterium]MBN2817852.1 TIGR00730 family Rossman fold protein [Bacteroidales bacterium]